MTNKLFDTDSAIRSEADDLLEHHVQDINGFWKCVEGKKQKRG
jgi:hypothetical protein